MEKRKKSKPKWKGTNITLRKSTYDRWCSKKHVSGFERKSHSDFADFLLESINHNSSSSQESEVDVCGISRECIVEGSDHDGMRMNNEKSRSLINVESQEKSLEIPDISNNENSAIIEETEEETILDESTLTASVNLSDNGNNSDRTFSPSIKRRCKGVVGKLSNDNARIELERSGLSESSIGENVLVSTPRVVSGRSSLRKNRSFKANFQDENDTSINFHYLSEDGLHTSVGKKVQQANEHDISSIMPLEMPDLETDHNSDEDLNTDPFKDVEQQECNIQSSSSDDDSNTEFSEAEFSDIEPLFDIGDIENVLGSVTKGIGEIDINPCEDAICELYVTESGLNQSVYSTKSCNATINRTVNMSLCSVSGSSDNFIDASLEANVSEVKQKLRKSIEYLIEKEMPNESKHVDQSWFIVSIDKLLELRGNMCRHIYSSGDICKENIEIEHFGRGAVRILKWKCPKNHSGKWDSSEILTVRHHSPVYVNDILFTSSVLISGNNYGKILTFCKIMNLNVPVRRVFDKHQNQYIAPVISSTWESVRENIISVLSNYTDICLCGDARNDSPGHCARFCSYVLMEHFTKVIIDIEVLDSRNSQGVSPNMERDALVILLTRLHHLMPIDEITTDASTSIMKAVREMAKKYPALAKIFHSLDIWHKSKSIRKALVNAGKIKGNEDLLIWVDSIVNHFWHCCQNCDQNEEKLKDMWIGVLHHVVDEHVWPTSECSHGDLTREDPKEYLHRSSKAFAALQSVILDPRLLASLKYYTKFRHTSSLENFNSMMLKYASKRIAFDFTYYTVRMYLAALDHNFHLFRENVVTQSGELLYHRLYCKRTGNWHAEPVKVEKTYPHARYLLGKIFEKRITDLNPTNRPSLKDPRDPKLISPVLAMREPPPTSSLVSERLSRIEQR